MESTRYDAIVVGAGQAGVPLAQALAATGMRTSLLEREHVGGTCVNEGCTPTKTMVASARVAYLARRGPDYGVQTGAIGIELTKVSMTFGFFFAQVRFCSVMKRPGQMAFTVTPCGAQSAATARVKWITAAFDVS